MKALSRINSSLSFGSLIERVEILRSTLRWAQHLEREEIQRLLGQCNELRDDVMTLSHRAPLSQQSGALEPLRPTGKSAAKSSAQRREALEQREFVFEGVFGDSPLLMEALEIAERAAPSGLPVLVRGESGTGKELMAKMIHANSDRSEQQFVSVNCGAIPENLIESELFGHKKGSFTGASSDRKGKFEAAHNGTIFLDEIGELPLSGQVKLLRVLQSHEIQRVGSDEVIRIDARIVAATNRNLKQMVSEGSFREDLYYRLSVIDVTLPALRDRRDEIPLLIDFFTVESAEQLGREPLELSPEVEGLLLHYAYPGNIRELRNIVFRLACLSDGAAEMKSLPEDMRTAAIADARTQQPLGEDASLGDLKRAASDAAERRFLERGLKQTNGRVVDLAKNAGLNRSHLQTLMKKHGLSAKQFRQRLAD